MNKAISIVALCVLPTISYAHQSGSGDVDASGFADRHAPIGVMGDHRHDAGEWMVSYRYMDMEMQGLKQGDDSIGRQAVASLPGVRVVPREMRMEMHMFGVMYAPSDRVTLMAMANYVEKDMDLVTYQGMSGTEELGDFSTSSRGWGDSSITALIGLLDSVSQNVHLNLGLNLPTGGIKKTDTALTPPLWYAAWLRHIRPRARGYLHRLSRRALLGRSVSCDDSTREQLRRLQAR